MRTIRAVLLTAVIWGIAWAVVGALFGLFEFFRSPPESSYFLALRLDLTEPMTVLGIAGFLAGATFASVMSRLDRGASLQRLSLPRVAVWGAVGGLGFAIALGALVVGEVGLIAALWPRAAIWTTVAAACGALSAAGSLAIARQGTPGVLEEAEAMQRIAGS
jgi:hypothetical protein